MLGEQKEKESLANKLERGRAEFAYKRVKQTLQEIKKESTKKEYRSYLRKIPQMILSSGLGQTLAFVFAKSKEGNAYKLIYDQITEYLKSDFTSSIKMPPDKNDLIEWVVSLDSHSYRYVTQEIISILNWLKRFAEGMIKDEKTE